MRITCALALLIALGCASSSSTPAQPEPQVTLRQLSNVAEAARYMTGGLSVQFSITVKNTTPNTLKLKRVDLQSVGMGAYTLPSTSKPFDLVLGPGETKLVDMWAPALVESATIVGANGPVSIRAVNHFESEAGAFQTVVVQQVHAGGGGD